MGPIVIRAEGLSKQYAIGRPRRSRTAREAIMESAWRWRRTLLPAGSANRGADTIWALDGVSFEVRQGDIVGVIGGNGAGKSTLLKLLSRITTPTRGRARVAGRVGSLLEVGTGFHQDLTGRENAYLNGAILGMRKAEIDRKFDEIVAFAEIERFVDTPVKHYSSGMYMRLAFAVAAHLETEILLVDEVLAVGDAQFQKKCIGKMDDIARHGRTVLFISHNMASLQRLCTTGLLLHRGKLTAAGPIADVVNRYRAAERRAADIGRFNPWARSGTGWARIKDIVVLDESGARVPRRAADADLTFEVTIEATVAAAETTLRGLVLELVVCTDQSQPLVSVMNVDDGGVELPATKRCRVRATLPGPTFIPGRYRLTASLGVPFLEHVDEIPDALEFEILQPESPWRPYELNVTRQIVCRKANWRCEADTAGGTAPATVHENMPLAPVSDR